MTIQEAIKSGLPIKRPHFTEFEEVEVDMKFRLEDVLAIDWEVEDEKFEVTEQELHKAFKDLKTNPDGYRWAEISKKLRDGHYK